MGAVVITTRRQLNSYPYLVMHPGHSGCCDWYENFAWQKRVVVDAVANLPYEFQIIALARRGDVLRIRIQRRYPNQADFDASLTEWQAVSVSRSIIGRPLPKRVLVLNSSAG